MSTTKMQAPSGFANSTVQGGNGSYTVDAAGFVTVDSRDVAALLTAGFLIVDALRIVASATTVSAGQASANAAVIQTGLTAITALSVMVLRAGNVVTADADVTFADGAVTVADGSTYNTTAGDVIHLIGAGV